MVSSQFSAVLRNDAPSFYLSTRMSARTLNPDSPIDVPCYFVLNERGRQIKVLFQETEVLWV